MEIPIQLRALKFCKIKKGTKKPYERDWVNKPYSYNEISEWLKKEDGNYGVLCGYEGLAVIDCDTQELKEAISKSLPETFTVKTGGGGTHFYYLCKELKKKIVLQINDKHFGEVQSQGTQVIGGNSTHPNGNKYEILKDLPIIELSKEQLILAVKPFMKEINEEEIKTLKELRDYGDSDINSIPIISMINTSGFKRAANGEYYGSNPWHGSSTGMNFWVNSSKNLGFCFRCQAGINVAKAIALNKNIIRNCSDKLSTSQFFEVLEIARNEHGLKRPEPRNEPTPLIIDIERNNRPEIFLPCLGRLISRFAEELATVLSDKNTLFFRPELNKIIEIGKVKDSKAQKEEYTGFLVMEPNRFITFTEQYAATGLMVEQEDEELEFSEKSMGSNIASIVLASSILQEALPPIHRIFTAPLPIIFEGKLTFPKKGYDERFCSWMPFNSPEITKPEMSLTEAKEILFNLLKEFCFQTEQDYANALAALLTPFLRGLFSSFTTRTPVFFYLANRERAGKDYLAGITGIIYEGQNLEESPISSGGNNNYRDTTEELRKKIFSAMINGRKRMHFSNNKGYINNAVFEAVSTAEKWSDRILGRNEMLVFNNELDFSLSGNVGVSFTPDFANRCRFVRLFLDIENANERTFENPALQEYAKENRGLILSALYSLVSNWIDLGKPSGSLKFASFHQWAKICGGIMEAASLGNPCVIDKETMALGGDSETNEMKGLFELCYLHYPEIWISKGKIKDTLINTESELFSYFDFTKKADQTKFGSHLNKFVGRIMSEISLIVKDKCVRSTRQEFKFTKLYRDTPKFDLRKSRTNLNTENGSLSLYGAKKVENGSCTNLFDKNLGHLGYLGHLLPLGYPNEKKSIDIIDLCGKVANVAKVPKDLPENINSHTQNNTDFGNLCNDSIIENQPIFIEKISPVEENLDVKILKTMRFFSDRFGSLIPLEEIYNAFPQVSQKDIDLALWDLKKVGSVFEPREGSLQLI